MLARGGGQTLASHQPILWFPKSAFPLARRLERSIEKLLVTSAHQNHTHTISGFQPGRIRVVPHGYGFMDCVGFVFHIVRFTGALPHANPKGQS
jgi:hypothetical protein